LCRFLQPLVTSSLLGPNTPLSILNLCSSLWVRFYWVWAGFLYEFSRKPVLISGGRNTWT
jgi:hypothetical protein